MNFFNHTGLQNSHQNGPLSSVHTSEKDRQGNVQFNNTGFIQEKTWRGGGAGGGTLSLGVRTRGPTVEFSARVVIRQKWEREEGLKVFPLQSVLGSC